MDEIYQNVLSEEEAKQILPVLQDLLGSVGQADSSENISCALKEKLHAYLPDKNENEISECTNNIINTLQTDSNELESLDSAAEKGYSREAWFAKETRQALSHYTAEQTLAYYIALSETIQQSNEQMLDAIMTNCGNVNMNPNLDGFIAEQYHVQSFNMDAAVKGSSFRAEIVGHKGEQYTKNGVDIVIKDGNKIVRRFQSKYCKDTSATEAALKHGDYRGQQALVPHDQLDEISEKGRKAVDVISHEGVSSKPLSKLTAKKLQNEAQNGKWEPVSYNDYNIKQLALGVGKQTANAALMGITITTGVTIAEKVVNGEEITADDVIETAIVTGADSGVKAAVSGALIIASEKGIISAIPKGTSVSIVSSIAFVAIENAKIAVKVADSEMSVTNGLSRMVDTTLAAVTGMSLSFVASAEIGAAIGMMICPPVGVITGFVAGTVGYIAGSKIGQAVSKGAKAVGKAAVNVVKTVGKGLVSVGKAVFNTAKSTISRAISKVGGFFSRW